MKNHLMSMKLHDKQLDVWRHVHKSHLYMEVYSRDLSVHLWTEDIRGKKKIMLNAFPIPCGVRKLPQYVMSQCSSRGLLH